eukprot:gene31636-39080_t
MSTRCHQASDCFERTDPEVTDFANRLPVDKSKLPSIKVLLDKKIADIHGGNAEKLDSTVQWMSFGIGM